MTCLTPLVFALAVVLCALIVASLLGLDLRGRRLSRPHDALFQRGGGTDDLEGEEYPAAFANVPTPLEEVLSDPANRNARVEPDWPDYVAYLASNPPTPLLYPQWHATRSEARFEARRGNAAEPAATTNVNAVCQSDSECNQRYGQGANYCLPNGQCACRVGDGPRCQIDPTYYLEPRQMTPEQVIRFKNQAKLQNMTLRDYINWLGLFRDDAASLPLLHRKNLDRLVRGFEIDLVPTPADVAEAQERVAPRGLPREKSATTIQSDSSRCSRLANGCDAPPGTPPNNAAHKTASGYYIEVPQIEADTAHNYRFQDDHRDSTGYAHSGTEPLHWARFNPLPRGPRLRGESPPDPDERFIHYNDKLVPFKTTPIANWFNQKLGITLGDVIGDTTYDPYFMMARGQIPDATD